MFRERQNTSGKKIGPTKQVRREKLPRNNKMPLDFCWSPKGTVKVKKISVTHPYDPRSLLSFSFCKKHQILYSSSEPGFGVSTSAIAYPLFTSLPVRRIHPSCIL